MWIMNFYRREKLYLFEENIRHFLFMQAKREEEFHLFITHIYK